MLRYSKEKRRRLGVVELRAACRGLDPSIFFPDRGEVGRGRSDPVRLAKKVCSGCSVRRECLDVAIENNEMSGVWGGMVRRERMREKVRRAKRAKEKGE